MKLGSDTAGYIGALGHLAGLPNVAKAGEAIQNINEKKRDRKAHKQGMGNFYSSVASASGASSGAKDIDAFHSATSFNQNVNDLYEA